MTKCEEFMEKIKKPESLELDNVEVYHWRKGKREFNKALLDFKTHLLIGEGRTCEIIPTAKIDMIVISNIHRIEIRDVEPAQFEPFDEEF